MIFFISFSYEISLYKQNSPRWGAAFCTKRTPGLYELKLYNRIKFGIYYKIATWPLLKEAHQLVVLTNSKFHFSSWSFSMLYKHAFLHYIYNDAGHYNPSLTLP